MFPSIHTVGAILFLCRETHLLDQYGDVVMNTAGRIFIAIFLFGSLVGMGVHYDATVNNHWPYPTESEVIEDYESNVGEVVFLSGRVTSSSPLQLRVSSNGESTEIIVKNTDAYAEPGGFIQVYGILREGRNIDSKRVSVINRTAESLRYKYAVSVVGALIVSIVFFRHWEIDIANRALSPREGDDG